MVIPASQVPADTPARPLPSPILRPLRSSSLPSASSVAVSTGSFEVMLNHARMSVERQYPFVNVASLFTAHAALGARSSGSPNHYAPPLHRYGSRPVLLLDYTGALHLRHERRALRQAIKTKTSQLLAERAKQIRIARAWRMRRLRALRSNNGAFITTPGGYPVDGQGEDREAHAGEVAVHYEGVMHTAADMERLINATGARRVAISQELQELREQLTRLAQSKRYGEATHEGCILMLPSPDTQEVRLCSGHHYRTVCFVGEVLMDVVPGEGPCPLPPPAVPSPSAVTEESRRSLSPETRPDHHYHLHQSSVGMSSQREAADTLARDAAPQSAPSWAKAELLGYTIFRRLQQSSKNPQRRGGSPSSISAYLALPACEAATYREWAIQKYGLPQP
ncbi:hypothetical protein ABL78_4409 [Leptomonas seymouri]|uniref:Uncharacterized protein n=1 Tax=Leptomonas seymouri TaxID=5684 RepID=A0A0N0P5X7_LEPSE|nr:hypothetical protein ABL78_4409 [Leptomonas seymouri]|eukprot:KPI86507.1 hypothetical protein ABL78_4409 [Leptomonas seymouri]